MSGEWAATLTGSSIARRAPSSFAIGQGRLDGRRARPTRRPGPGSCGSPLRRSRGDRPRRTSSGRRASSSPMMRGHRGPRARPRTAASGGRARGRAGGRRRSGTTPAATRALYWPIEWPGAEGRLRRVDPEAGPALAQGGEVGDRRREQGRLGVDRQVELVGGSLEGQAADRLAERGVGFGEDGRGGRRGGGQGLAHADRLRPLAGEDEGDPAHALRVYW